MERLSPETREALTKPGDPAALAALEAYRAMDPEVRRSLTLCASLCIPIPPPTPAQQASIREFLKRAGIPDTHQNLREYLHDQNARGEMAKAVDALEKCQTLADAQRLFDAAITRWATERGGSARKVGDRWEFTRADGSVVLEWSVDTYGKLAAQQATNSYFQAHHGVQHAWAEGRKIPGYTQDGCPAILLRDSYAGSPHRRITDRQNQMKADAPNRTYAEERKLMIDDLRGSEVSNTQADALVNQSDAYFGKLYKAWEAELKKNGQPDTALRDAFGTWTPTVTDTPTPDDLVAAVRALPPGRGFLAAPSAEAALDALVADVGRPLPADLRALLLLSDGIGVAASCGCYLESVLGLRRLAWDEEYAETFPGAWVIGNDGGSGLYLVPAGDGPVLLVDRGAMDLAHTVRAGDTASAVLAAVLAGQNLWELPRLAPP